MLPEGHTHGDPANLIARVDQLVQGALLEHPDGIGILVWLVPIPNVARIPVPLHRAAPLVPRPLSALFLPVDLFSCRMLRPQRLPQVSRRS